MQIFILNNALYRFVNEIETPVCLQLIVELQHSLVHAKKPGIGTLPHWCERLFFRQSRCPADLAHLNPVQESGPFFFACTISVAQEWLAPSPAPSTIGELC